MSVICIRGHGVNDFSVPPPIALLILVFADLRQSDVQVNFLPRSCCDNLARTVGLDKRYREAAEPHADGGTVGVDTQQMLLPQKRARGGDDATNEILKVARSAARTRHNAVARIVQGIYMYH